jgi:hypothetical protein
MDHQILRTAETWLEISRQMMIFFVFFCLLVQVIFINIGGLGVTLTAADTVIFYDNDWNPTMDA